MNMKSVEAVRSKDPNLKPTARAYACIQTERQAAAHSPLPHVLLLAIPLVLSSQLRNHISSCARQFLIPSLNMARTEFQNGMENG